MFGKIKIKKHLDYFRAKYDLSKEQLYLIKNENKKNCLVFNNGNETFLYEFNLAKYNKVAFGMQRYEIDMLMKTELGIEDRIY